MTAWLLVRRADLARELTRMARLARGLHKRADAVLDFSDRRLTIALPGMRTAVPADGTWVPRVRVLAHVMLDLGLHLPKEDPLLIKVQEGFLVIGDHAVTCRLDHPEFDLVQIPHNAQLAEILRVAAKHTPEEIERSGISRVVRRAQERRERMIARAAAILGPLGISVADLDQLVEERLRSHSSAPRRQAQTRPRRERVIARAAAVLGPLGVSDDDVYQLVREHIRSYWVAGREEDSP